MRTIESGHVVEAVRAMVIEASCRLPAEVEEALRAAAAREHSPLGKSILECCLKNAEIARQRMLPLCQDCGLSIVFVRQGRDVMVTGDSLTDAIDEGVRRGTKEGYLRASVLADPLFARENTKDNTPAIVHIETVPGETLEIMLAPKGAGAENMSRIAMLPPAAGEAGVIEFVVETVVKAGGNPCPPVVVGVGIGGNFESAAMLAKQALFRPLGAPHPDLRYRELEQRILKRVNASGIGPQGLGGITTALAVHVEHAPCHLASLPVAVNLNCHAHRYARRVL